VPSDGDPGGHLLRVRSDDPEYRRQAAAEAAFWERPHPFGLETTEKLFAEGPIDRYVNRRFTGNPRVHWTETVARWGTFRRGLLLGTSSLTAEARLLETNPTLHLTVLDISPGALARREQAFGKRFPGRTATEVADLNFVTFDGGAYDLIASSSSIHHVTNLEHLAFAINQALTPDGYFFLEDYVGEPRFGCSEGKRRLFEAIYARDLARQRGRKGGLVWLDASDLSPFCGIRSDEILDVFDRYLERVEVRTAGALTIPLMRSRPADLAEAWRPTRWQVWLALVKRRLGVLRSDVLSREFLEELFLVGDVAADAGVVRPGIAFGVYRKRRDSTP
jgi:SAM-dependent methyltransferase